MYLDAETYRKLIKDYLIVKYNKEQIVDLLLPIIDDYYLDRILYTIFPEKKEEENE